VTITLALIAIIVVIVARVNLGGGAQAQPPPDTNINDLIDMSTSFNMTPGQALGQSNADRRAFKSYQQQLHNARVRARALARQRAWQATVARLSNNPTALEAKQQGEKMNAARGWGSCWSSLDAMWDEESGWSTTAENPFSAAYGIPQSLPGEKMATAGSNWEHSAITQIAWGLGYIAARYGNPCDAWSFHLANGWY
jgi:hypothetical protein